MSLCMWIFSTLLLHESSEYNTYKSLSRGSHCVHNNCYIQINCLYYMPNKYQYHQVDSDSAEYSPEADYRQHEDEL